MVSLDIAEWTANANASRSDEEMKRRAKNRFPIPLAIAALLLTFLLTACGTIASRGGKTAFGAYPYYAVAADATFITAEKEDIKTKIAAFVSLPIDLVADTLLLPPDVICWISGKKKDGVFSQIGK